MNPIINDIDTQYLSCLRDYLNGEEESGLACAYEVGRLANAKGMGILDLLSIHQRALDSALGQVKEQEDFLQTTRIANRLLSESLASFEMTNRGFKESVVALVRSNQKLEREINERKRLEDDLRKTNAQLEERVKERTREVMNERHRLFNVLETLPVMICLLTPDHHVTFANRAFRERFGESHGRHCYEYCFGYDKPCEFCESYEALETGKPHQWEVTSPDGKAIIDAYDFPFTDIDGTPMILEMDIDITERKQFEAALKKLNDTLEQRVAGRTAELEAANKELEAFSYSVSHDLRAPLRGINGFSSILIEDYGDKLDEQAKKYLNNIVSSTALMSHLIDDLLKLSRIGRAEMKSGVVNLGEMARSIIRDFEHLEPERKVKFVDSPNSITIGDASLLKILLQNLLGNAWKYTSKVEGARIEFGYIESDGDKTFFVKDNGVGFDMAYSNKLFQPFQRLHSETDFPGNGIGLAIVQRIINRHGGRIWAEGEIKKGSTFYFRLYQDKK